MLIGLLKYLYFLFLNFPPKIFLSSDSQLEMISFFAIFINEMVGQALRYNAKNAWFKPEYMLYFANFFLHWNYFRRQTDSSTSSCLYNVSFLRQSKISKNITFSMLNYSLRLFFKSFFCPEDIIWNEKLSSEHEYTLLIEEMSF